MDRLPISALTMKRLKEAALGLHGAWKKNAANTILKQEWISSKQLYHIHSNNYKRTVRRVYGGYDGPPDNAGNGYVTGE